MFSQNIDCSSFKIGEFKYVNPKYSEWKITRTDSLQIEISSKTGIEIHSLVNWKSDCEYVLTCTKVLYSNPENILGQIFTVFITETYSDRYRCISKNTDTKIQDLELEIIKVK
ncbi:hypothetical protein [uncultured Algibacter sp.]|uniref:hypothetical protein n=1 Tax=uncultured Algibacter sp. TaxID=298659 RepID=UPI002635620D|nr:hypothetical protein [uncultured Algibacter sp.]